MKKLLVKPGFEFIFSISFIAILCLPPVLLAQNKVKKDVDIRIQNGDTIINGKNIKDLSTADRQDALTDINNLRQAPDKRHDVFFKRMDTTGGTIKRMEFRRKVQGSGDQTSIAENFIVKDSLGNIVEMRPGKARVINRRQTLSYRMNDDDAGNMKFRERGFDRGMGPRRVEQRNTQNFDYENTNNDGVITHITFHVSEASDDDLKRMPYVEGPKFEIKDLNLVPEFSSGKVLLMFNLLSKAPAEVKLSDSDGKLIWTEKAISGKFSKSFALGLNGIYYLQIQQGKSISLKKIMKEE